MTAMQSSTSFITDAYNFIPLRAESATTPGIGYLSTDTNKWGYGPKIKQVYNAVYTDVRIAFLADASGKLEQFFADWMNLVYDFSHSNDQNALFTANYRNDIVSSQISVTKFDRKGNAINTYNIFEAFPIRYAPLNLDWNTIDANLKLLTEFAFTSFSLDNDTLQSKNATSVETPQIFNSPNQIV